MITQDIAKLVVQIENSTNNKELQNELTKLQQRTAVLKNENKRLKFVVNAAAVNNPIIKPVLDIIDMAQKTERYKHSIYKPY